MIEIDEEATDGAPFARTYDFFKFMTGLALLSLGGVFAFVDGNGTQFERRQVVVIIAFIGLAGLTSLFMAGGLAGLEVKPAERATVVRKIRIAQMIVSFALSGGLAGFVYNFIPAILK